MISPHYLLSLLAWLAILGIAVVAGVLVVPGSLRSRVMYSTLLFTIPLAITGFIDRVSTQLRLVECSGGVVAVAMFMVVLTAIWDSIFLSRTDSSDTSNP